MKGPLLLGELLSGSRLVVLGGTGFLGKVFWAMLLDRYPDLGQIYLLVRKGRGEGGEVESSEARFWRTIATSHVFDPLREHHPGAAFEALLRAKVTPFDGDVGKPLCGLDPSLIAELSGTIDAVINVAGVVDFNPALDDALQANAFGAKNLVALARALGDGSGAGAAPLLHTSTCYVAGRRPKGIVREVDPREVPFPRAGELSPLLWDAEREIDECLELIAHTRRRANDAFRQSEFEHQARKNLEQRGEPTAGAPLVAEVAKQKRTFLKKHLVSAGLDRASHWGWPNIYTYTKSIGEQVIAASGVPFTIVRPACCETTMEFPFQGWNEGISTSAPLIYLIMNGQVQIPLEDVPLDFIPTDYVTSGMVAALGELLEGDAKPVYQIGSSDSNACSASRFGELTGLYKRKHYQKRGKGNPLLNLVQAHLEPVAVSVKRFDAVGPPGMASAARGVAGLLRRTSSALGPAAQALTKAAAQEEKIGVISKLFAPFTTEQNGPFSCDNTRAAYARLPLAERAKLPFAVHTLDWASWFHTVHMPAMEKWILPEMDKKLARAPRLLEPHATVVSLFQLTTARFDRAVALQRLEADGFSRITYRDLHARAGTVAARLAAAGVVHGDRVVLAGTGSPEWAMAFFGALLAGATVVLMPTASPAHDARWVLGEGQGPHSLEALTASDPNLPAPAVTVSADDVAIMLGAAGTPLTHGALTALLSALTPLFPLRPGDRLLSVLPPWQLFELTAGLLLPLSRGARVAYLDEVSGKEIGRALEAGDIEAIVGVPAVWELLERRVLAQVSNAGPLAEAAFRWGRELSRVVNGRFGVDAGRLLFGPAREALGGKVKYLISGGASVPQATVDLLLDLGVPLQEPYGVPGAVLGVGAAGRGRTRAKPLPGVEMAVREPDAAGVGDVRVRAPRFGVGGKSGGTGGWVETGFVGSLDKRGRLTRVGSTEATILTEAGERVHPEAIERALGRTPGLREVAVVVLEGETLACVASLDPRAHGEALAAGEALARASRALHAAVERLPPAERPATLRIEAAKLPRGADGAFDRQAIAELAAAPQAPFERPVDAAEALHLVRSKARDFTRELSLSPELQEAGKRAIGKLQDAFYGQVMKPRVTGRAFIPHNRNTIVVANHSSHLDMGLVRHALGTYGEDIVALAAQDYFFEGGSLRKAFFENLTNLKPIDRSGGLRASLREAREVIRRGNTVLLFPEGTRSLTGELGDFKPMVGHLALVHGVDLLPVYLGGTHAAMPKGAVVPTRRDVLARIGPPLAVEDLRRLTHGMPPAEAAREVARLAREAVAALRDGQVLDLRGASKDEPVAPVREHPLVTLFAELEEKFKPAQVDKPVSWYFTLGSDELAKWTVIVDAQTCRVTPGKPANGTADCVLKTSSEIFTKIVRESYVPGPADFMSGAIKSNDVSLLMTFQKVFQLES